MTKPGNSTLFYCNFFNSPFSGGNLNRIGLPQIFHCISSLDFARIQALIIAAQHSPLWLKIYSAILYSHGEWCTLYTDERYLTLFIFHFSFMKWPSYTQWSFSAKKPKPRAAQFINAPAKSTHSILACTLRSLVSYLMMAKFYTQHTDRSKLNSIVGIVK